MSENLFKLDDHFKWGGDRLIDNDNHLCIGDRVVVISPTADKKHVRFLEMCDEYFPADLDKSEVKEVIDYLQRCYNDMED